MSRGNCTDPLGCSRDGFCSCPPKSTAAVEYGHPKRMTEREARIAGATSNRLCNLRGMLTQGIKEGSIVVRTSNGSQSLTLPLDEVEAVIGLLIERDEAFLIGLDIELERITP